MDLDDKYNEAMLMIDWLRNKFELSDGYRIVLEISPESGVNCGKLKRKKVSGFCLAKSSEALVVLAGDRGLAGILRTVAHEFKHILQTVEGCKLKKLGKARERQANEFAEKEFPLYLEERFPGAPSNVQSELEVMLFLVRLDRELEQVRASVA